MSDGYLTQVYHDGETGKTTTTRVSLSPEEAPFAGLVGFWERPYAQPPSHLPDPLPLLAFNVDEKKREIFNQARNAIRNSAQYTKRGRKPWTQITVKLPLSRKDTSEDEDLAVIYHLMQETIRDEPKEGKYGDKTWTLWGSDAFLKWLGIDLETTRPADKYVHPVQYETGSVERKRIEKKLKKDGPSEELEKKLAALNAKEKDPHYRWSSYEECEVTFKKKQSRKEKDGELVLTIRIRTYLVGTGDPKDHDGFMKMSLETRAADMDPSTDLYRLLKARGMLSSD